MKKIFIIRQLIISIIAFLILIFAFFKNNFFSKVIISPFLICSIAIFFKDLFLLLNNKKLADIFKYIFRISFFIYWFGFLCFFDFICIKDRYYFLLLISLLFWIIGFKTFHNLFFSKGLKK